MQPSHTVAAAMLLLVLCLPAAHAGENWTASRVDVSSLPPDAFADPRPAAPGGLPDGVLAVPEGDGDIAAAWYGDPTTRYGHGVIGDRIEAATLIVRTRTGDERSLTLPKTEVFEDRYPRLADLDGDGRIEVVTIRSSTSLGASLTIYGLRGGGLAELAATGFIGLANRWLNIAGIADIDRVPGLDVAYVETPHIGGTLFVYRFTEGRLELAGALAGFSNHAIGSRELRLSAVADIDGDGRMELALPSVDRRSLKIVSLGKKGLHLRASIELPARIDKAITATGTGPQTRFTLGLANGTAYIVHR